MTFMPNAFLTLPQAAVPVLLALVLTSLPTIAAEGPAADAVLIANSRVSVTRAEYDAELLKLPPNLRDGFPNNPRRVTDLLTRMLVTKTLATVAKAAKLDQPPIARLRVELEIDRLLAQFMIEDVEAKAEANFDVNRVRFEVRARESFLVDKAKY